MSTFAGVWDQITGLLGFDGMLTPVNLLLTVVVIYLVVKMLFSLVQSMIWRIVGLLALTNWSLPVLDLQWEAWRQVMNW